MIRVTSGTAKNTKLRTPDIEKFRAVQDVVKQSVFSVLGEASVRGATVLDLFCGSGGLGIEALSRGASWCDFVDEHSESVQTVLSNLQRCGFMEKAQMFNKNSLKFVTKAERTYDIIFADPFYNDLNQRHLLKMLPKVMCDKGVAVFFHGDQLPMHKFIEEAALKIATQRKFGNSFFTMLQSA